MTYAALIEDQSRPAETQEWETASTRRRQSDQRQATKNGRRWSDHVEVHLVGSDQDHGSEPAFMTTAFAAQVLGQFTTLAQTPARDPRTGEIYQLNQKIIAPDSAGIVDRGIA